MTRIERILFNIGALLIFSLLVYVISTNQRLVIKEGDEIIISETTEAANIIQIWYNSAEMQHERIPHENFVFEKNGIIRVKKKIVPDAPDKILISYKAPASSKNQKNWNLDVLVDKEMFLRMKGVL